MCERANNGTKQTEELPWCVTLFVFLRNKKSIPFEKISVMAVPKATTIKEAIKRFEDKAKCNAIDAKEVQLQFQWPPIEKLDPQLGTLVKCE